MSAPQRNAYEDGYYAAVQSMELGLYTFNFALQICPFPHGHNLRSHWMKGWQDARD